MATDLTVANEILAQLGGARKLKVIIGAHSFMGDENSLQFRIKARATKGIKAVKVVLDPSDTYTVEFWKIRGTNVEKVETRVMVYCDQLVRVIEEVTALRLRLVL